MWLPDAASRYRLLTLPERRAVREAVVLTALARLTVPFFPIRSLRCFSVLAGTFRRHEADIHAARISALVAAVASCLGARCLARSAVLACMLRRRGLDAAVVVGVRKHAGDLDPHAWVEHDGVTFLGPNRHVPLWRHSFP